jgi:hypothetical protein
MINNKIEKIFNRKFNLKRNYLKYKLFLLTTCSDFKYSWTSYT